MFVPLEKKKSKGKRRVECWVKVLSVLLVLGEREMEPSGSSSRGRTAVCERVGVGNSSSGWLLCVVVGGRGTAGKGGVVVGGGVFVGGGVAGEGGGGAESSAQVWFRADRSLKKGGGPGIGRWVRGSPDQEGGGRSWSVGFI